MLLQVFYWSFGETGFWFLYETKVRSHWKHADFRAANWFHTTWLNGLLPMAVANDIPLIWIQHVRRAPSARRQVDVQANTAILTDWVKQSGCELLLRKETPLGGGFAKRLGRMRRGQVWESWQGFCFGLVWSAKEDSATVITSKKLKTSYLRVVLWVLLKPNSWIITKRTILRTLRW
jgi:hypothetical protein